MADNMKSAQRKEERPSGRLTAAGKLFPRMTVGVMGSAGGKLTVEVRRKVRRLGKGIARRGYVLITGACPGLPHEAVKGAKEAGGIVVGVSPALNFEEHVKKYHSPTRGYDAIIYTGSGLMGREIENIRSCDVVIFAGGRSGTLGEFAIAYDEAKVIGVLKSTGGITDHLETIIDMVDKETGSIVCCDDDPERLLNQLEEVYRRHIYPRHLRAMRSGSGPDGRLQY
ncbi:MAG: hypothetical protein QUS33_01515 [Dehalococcoidia bacterium]|nr:hypothetical protein [Dehalococcoidia bacterium]